MRRIWMLFGVLSALSLQAFSVSTPIVMPQKEIQHNHSSLQRGAKLFMDYCSGCHSLQYLRYNRLATDLGLTKPGVLQNNLIYTQATPQDPIQISMPAEDARQWFGQIPPDLSLKVNERGAPWVHDFLDGFYPDSKRPFGSNNKLKLDVAMPNILFALKESGISNEAYETALNDIVAFLTYVSNPDQPTRFALGWKVLLFLAVLLVILLAAKLPPKSSL